MALNEIRKSSLFKNNSGLLDGQKWKNYVADRLGTLYGHDIKVYKY